MANETELIIEFECLECGGATLVLPDNSTDDAIAKCESCGKDFGRWGDIQSKAYDAAFVNVADTIARGLGEVVKRSKHFKMR